MKISIEMIQSFDHTFQTRKAKSLNFNIPPDFQKGDLVYTILDLFNTSSNSIKSEILGGHKGTVKSMKNKIKNYIFDQYEKCNLQNCYSCEAFHNPPKRNHTQNPTGNNNNQTIVQIQNNLMLPQLQNPLLNPLLNPHPINLPQHQNPLMTPLLNHQHLLIPPIIPIVQQQINSQNSRTL